MQAVEILVDEHDLILELLDHLAVASKRITQNQGPPKAFFEKAMDICREFADKFHHYKEEYVMFGLLAQKHDGAIDGEIERHRNQHEQCRNLIQLISESLDGYTKELDSVTRTLFRNLNEYVQTLRSHIRSENDVFFPMVVDALTESENQTLLEEFKKYEAKTGGNVMETYRERVDEIAGLL